MFKQDLEVIDALRRDAVNIKEPHPSGIKKISAYAGQLSWMGGKFPIDVNNLICLHKLRILIFWGRLG
jgi:programmed cell death 6-interacting protein